MYKVLVQNCITRSGPDYKCHLCPCMIRSCQYEAVLEHINNSRHKELAELHAWDQKRQTKKLETIVNFTEEEYQTMVEKGIIFKSTFYWCTVCKCKCNEFQKHLATDKHWHKLHYQLTVKDEKGSGKARGKDQNNKMNQGNLSNPNDPNYQQLQENLIEVLQTDKLYRCTVCNYFIAGIDEIYEHIKETKHMENFEKRKKHFTRKSKIISKTKKYIGENRYFYCSKCEVYLTANQTLLQCHCMMHLHQEQTNLNFDIIKFKFEENNKVNITCLLCNVIMDSDKTLAEHLESTKHLYKLDFFNFLNNKVIRHILAPKQKINVKILQSYNFNPHRDIYLTDFCTLCQEKPNLDSSSHLQKIKPVQKSLNKTQMFQHESTHSKLALEGDSILYKCFLCNQSFVSKTLLFNHYGKGSPHSSKFTNLCTILKEPEEEFYKQLTSINDKIEQLVLEKKKCIKPKKSKEKDLQFPYNKDLLDFGDKYITMCLESGNENIYNFMLDSDQIQLIEFGISLTYVTKGQRICLPCNYKFLPYLQFLYDHLQDETHIQNLCDIKEDDEELKKYSPDQISYLGLAQSCMIEKSDELVNCLACNITITNNDNDIIIHMNLEDHISKLKPWKENIASITKIFSTIFKDPWYYADKFYCKICNLTLNREISFVKHLDQPEHEEKLKLCKTDNKINICYACSSCWYGPSNYNKHCKDFIHFRFFKRRDLMHPQMKKAAIAFLKNNVNNYVKKLIIESDKLIEINKEKELLESVEETVRNVYPHAKAYAFGSRSSYIGFPTSDVDIFLDCENVYNDIGSRNESQEYIRKLKSLFLGGSKKVWKSDGILLQPRVPIMKLQHKITGLKCDISFLNGLGVEKSKLIRYMKFIDL